MLHDIIHAIISFLAWDIFNTWTLSALTAILGLIHLWRHLNPSCTVCRDRFGYLARSFNWFVFSVSFALFPFLPLIDGRAILRLSVSFLILSELVYQWYYLGAMTSGVLKTWTKQLQLFL